MLSALWEDFLKSFASKEGKNPIIYSILGQLHPKELTEKKIVLSCENEGYRFFFHKKIPLIEKHLSDFLNKKVVVEIVVVPRRKKLEAPLLQFQPNIDDVFKKAGLLSRYGFDNFAVSSTNQVAYAAAKAVFKKPSKAYNPLFLYGGVGVGKTHLAQAVARGILEKSPEKKVFFCPGDQFTNELIESIREKTTPKFRRKYRHLDLLIVDDVQFIGGKNAVQEEFFHTFNTIVSAGGQIILISDKPPGQIKNLEDRLRSRFSGGLTVDIQAPDFELRTAIVLIKAQEKNIEIDIESAKVIAQQITDSRALEGMLLSLYAKALGDGGQVNLETIEDFFQKSVKKKTERINPDDVVKAVCSYYNLKVSLLKGPDRSEAVARARQIAMFLLRRDLRLKFEAVAFLLKKKDHTTVMHGVDKISLLISKDIDLKREVDGIRNLLNLSTGY